MRGKVAFVLGAALGYVLGARAGRARYEQIKHSAERLWQSEPVQKGTRVVQSAVGDKVEQAKDFAKRVGVDVLSSTVNQVRKTQDEASNKSNKSKDEDKDGDKADENKDATRKGSD